MNSLALLGTGLIITVLYVMFFWYFIRTLMIMGRQNVLVGILGFFVAPITQIIFYVTSKDQLSLPERSAFKRYWLSMVLILALGIVAIMIMNSQGMIKA